MPSRLAADDWEGEGSEGEQEEEGGGAETGVPLTAVELFVQREEKLVKKKEAIALIQSQLMKNPEGDVRS
jgi:hypothetical protein